MKKTNRTTLVVLLLCVVAGSFTLAACNGDYYNPNMSSLGGDGTNGNGTAMMITVTGISEKYVGKYADLSLFPVGGGLAFTNADQGTLITTPSMTLRMEANSYPRSPFNKAGTYLIEFDIREGKDIFSDSGSSGIGFGLPRFASYRIKSKSLAEGSNTIKWDEFEVSNMIWWP